MDQPIRQPEEILAYRSLQSILASKPRALWKISASDTVLKALQLMADKDIGFLPVMQQDRLAGVVSERDCARKVVLAGNSPEAITVGEIMVRDVITADLALTFADCLKLMHRHGIRHLPVIDKGRPVAVISIRDLLSEAVAHHARIIAELERERLTIFTSTA